MYLFPRLHSNYSAARATRAGMQTCRPRPPGLQPQGFQNLQNIDALKPDLRATNASGSVTPKRRFREDLINNDLGQRHPYTLAQRPQGAVILLRERCGRCCHHRA